MTEPNIDHLFTDIDSIITNKNYLDLIQSKYLSVCNNKSVLEIAPYRGWHTRLISKQEPTSITVVEPDTRHNKFLELPNVEVVNEDIFHYLETTRSFDVVVCFGLLYHLHHPLYLLELIANRVNPQYIILDSVDRDKSGVYIVSEQDNTFGGRQVSNWKSCQMSINVPRTCYFQAMTNLGYELLTHDVTTNNPDFDSCKEWGMKHQSWFGIWKRK